MISLKNIITRFIKKMIAFSGYELRGIKPIVSHNDYNSIHKFLVSEILKCEEPIVFDVGANDGESIERFKKIFSRFKIYSFDWFVVILSISEPQKDVFVNDEGSIYII